MVFKRKVVAFLLATKVGDHNLDHNVRKLIARKLAATLEGAGFTKEEPAHQ